MITYTSPGILMLPPISVPKPNTDAQAEMSAPSPLI